MTEDNLTKARLLAGRLHDEGHTDAAQRLQDATIGERAVDAVLFTLREACEFVLTSIEALDPKTEAMAEELRLEVETRLRR